MFEELDFMMPDAAFDGPMQMALDEVLLELVSRPALRIYRWAKPCVTFGYSQKYSEVRSTHPTLPLVRRRTGGGMVEHGDDLTFSLIIPRGNISAALSPTLFYKKLHHTLAEFLSQVSTREIRLAGDEEILSGPSCFSAPARDDLLDQGKKILGGAQCRSAGALLYQGSLQGMGESGQGREFVQAFAQSISSRVFTCLLSASLDAEARDLAKNRYASQAWNERR